ncbi:hypothetical protein BH23PAT2_BH23PAT2_03850 [soil metagenome]
MSNYSDSQFNFEDKNNSWYKTFYLVPENSTVLDIGCSGGNFGQELIKQKNCIVDGIEINRDDIDIARKKLRNVYELNIELNEININQEYDVLFMGDVIEHLADPVNALRKLKKLLKPEGVLVFSIPNITHMSVRLMLLRGKIEYGKTGLLDETHLHFYNSIEIYRVLNTAGYKVVTFDHVKRDIPFEVIKDELQEIGLRTTKKFKNTVQSLDGAAYQFIGTAKIGVATDQKLPDKSPIDVTDKRIKIWRKEYEKNRLQYVKQREEFKKQTNSLKEKLEAAKDEISNLKKSKILKAVDVVRGSRSLEKDGEDEKN